MNRRKAMSSAKSAQPAMTSSERLVMLLSLVGFLREREYVAVSEVAQRFGVTDAEVRALVAFLGTAGVPGDTQRYQHEDLFDIDWDALELRDEVRLTQVIAVDDAPRFAPAETAALIAGLHALIPMLPEPDAARAQELAAKLARALEGSAAFSLEQDPADPRIAVLFEALREGVRVKFGYRDAAGVATVREVRPLSLSQDGDAWYLRGFCMTRQAERSFRVAQMVDVVLGETDPVVPVEAEVGAASATGGGYELTATVPAECLEALAGFSPRVVGEVAPGRLRVVIHAWHDALALQLMRVAPGRVEIEAPDRPRAAVREWAERALAAYDI